MAGQQQILKSNNERYYNEALTTMLKQADLMYFEDRYKIGDGFNDLKAMHSYLYENTLCTSNCDLLKWIQKKIAGKLEIEEIEIVNLKKLQSKRPDVYITNIYNTETNWTDATW